MSSRSPRFPGRPNNTHKSGNQYPKVYIKPVIDIDIPDSPLENNQMLILSGAPGSGKTTFANALKKKSKKCLILSLNDQFTVSLPGKPPVFKFDPKYVKFFYIGLFAKCIAAMQQCKPIIVDCNNQNQSDVDTWSRLAACFGYNVEIKYFNGEFKNSTDIPQEIVDNKRKLPRPTLNKYILNIVE